MPRSVTWAAVLTEAIISIGAPAVQVPAPGAVRDADAAAMVHLTLLAQTGRGAVLVAPGGRIRFMNRVAEEMAGDGFAADGGAFRCHFAHEQEALLAALDRAFLGKAAGMTGEPLVLTRSLGRRPLLVQPVLIGDTTTETSSSVLHPGEGTVLLLLTDADRGTERDPARALELLGLAPAEARVAALVGAGLAPKEVARRLGNTEGTVRFSLNQIYRKLGVGRQSELARIVSRLEIIGI
jgi:DNA-binding CsgD family transcriptional regulator